MVYVKRTIVSIKILEVIRELHTVAGYKIDMQKSSVFAYIRISDKFFKSTFNAS